MTDDGLGLTAAELEEAIGRKIDPKLVFVVVEDAIYWRASGRWYRSIDMGRSEGEADRA